MKCRRKRFERRLKRVLTKARFRKLKVRYLQQRITKLEACLADLHRDNAALVKRCEMLSERMPCLRSI